MSTYMLTWNPHQRRPENLKKQVAQINRRKLYRGGWSVGNRKHLAVGSRVFLVKQGMLPKGVVASGFTTSTPEPRNDPDDHSNYCDIDFTMILRGTEGDILPLEDLKADPVLREVNWGSQCGGVLFTDDQAARLETLWHEFLKSRDKIELPR